MAGKHIMVVDDNESEQMITEFYITQALEKASVTQALSAEEALSQLKNGSMPDCILLDVNMPVMDGFMFVEACQQSLETIPKIVMFSSSLDDAIKKRALSYPAVKQYMEKPLPKEYFRELVS